ncbi:hypothetical protein D3C73_1404380 [compost metagenome]
MFMHIGEIAETIPVVTPETKCDEVYHLLKTHPNLEGLAIAGEDEGLRSSCVLFFFKRLVHDTAIRCIWTARSSSL